MFEPVSTPVTFVYPSSPSFLVSLSPSPPNLEGDDDISVLIGPVEQKDQGPRLIVPSLPLFRHARP